MATVWISLGRNVGAAPMPLPRWQRAQQDIKALVEHCGGSLIFAGEGSGIWQDKITESAYVVGALVESDTVGRLRQQLQWVASEYEQDAVGLTAQDGSTIVERV
jgi:hypothetical protein